MTLAMVPTPVSSDLAGAEVSTTDCIWGTIPAVVLLPFVVVVPACVFLNLLQTSQSFCDLPISFLFESGHTVNYIN